MSSPMLDLGADGDWAGWVRLSLVPGLGLRRARQLLAAFGLPQQIFAADAGSLGQLLPARLVDAVRQVRPEDQAQWARTLSWLQAAGDDPPRAIVTLGDPGYPAALLDTEDPPLLLYLMGNPALLQAQVRRSIAVVGSRNPSAQGADNARAFAYELVQHGLHIVSGLAQGIDAAAHEGALRAIAAGAGLARTVAVVGTGLDRVYPAQHRDLAHRIARDGLLVSEYPVGTPPLAQNFPRRNRLIAGLSRGTLVVEAALQSGSLITARLAVEQGKDVFAIPGSIHAPQSKGCHALIKQGAKLVESAQDILEEWSADAWATGADGARAAAPAAHDAGAPTGDALRDALGYDPVGLDALQARTGLPTDQLQARLLELELEGEIVRLPGGLFQRQALA